MKTLLVLPLVLLSTSAFANGYRCDGGAYRVAVYNHTDSSQDSTTPAVMVVSRPGEGTVAVISSDRISLDPDGDDDTNGWVYEGQGNSKIDGSFLSVRLEIKEKTVSIGNVPMHGGTFLINYDHDQDVVAMRCKDFQTQQP